jgi:hypothetical protein
MRSFLQDAIPFLLQLTRKSLGLYHTAVENRREVAVCLNIVRILSTSFSAVKAGVCSPSAAHN